MSGSPPAAYTAVISLRALTSALNRRADADAETGPESGDSWAVPLSSTFLAFGSRAGLRTWTRAIRRCHSYLTAERTVVTSAVSSPTTVPIGKGPTPRPHSEGNPRRLRPINRPAAAFRSCSGTLSETVPSVVVQQSFSSTTM